MTTKKHATLSQALARAQASADRIAKDSTNQFARFDYTSAESMMEMWTKIGEAQGLILYPAELSIDDGNLRTRWILEHADSEATRQIQMDWPIVEAKGKPRDKAVASARTSSLGYLIRDLLIAPRVQPTDDMDHPRWSQPEKAEPAPRKKAPQKPAPAPQPAKSAKPQSWESKHAERLLAAGLTPEEASGVAYRIKGEVIDDSWPDDRLDGLIRFVIEDERGRKVLDAVRAEQ